MSSPFRRILDLDDFQRQARRTLPRAVYGYVAHGAETEATLRGNRAAFARWHLIPRVLVGVETRNQSAGIFGHRYAAPFGIAPMGGSALVGYDADAAMAAAAREANIPFILSANSITPLEEVLRVNPDAWFAAYQSPDERSIRGMADRLARAGGKVLVLTADVPIGSNRESDARAGFSFPIRPNLRLGFDVATHPRWTVSVLLRTFMKRGIPNIVDLEPWGGPNLFSRKVAGIAAHEALCWDHARLMRKVWQGRFIVKGILSPADVAVAREIGADGVILSDHGGRQLDYAVAPLDMLEEALGQARDMTVLIDSGFRRGTDIVKALALGAHGVFVGRPFLFAAAYGGRAAVRHAIKLLAKELDRDMAMLGVTSLGEITRDRLKRAVTAA